MYLQYGGLMVMKRSGVLVLLFVLLLAPLSAEIAGTWQRDDSKLEFEILPTIDGKYGSFMVIEGGEATDSGFWRVDDEQYSLTLGYSSGNVKVVNEDLFIWRSSAYTRTDDVPEAPAVTIKDDSTSFVEQLLSVQWKNFNEKKTYLFRRTFSLTEGVVEIFDFDGELVELKAWSISSGILKVGSNLYVNAFASEQHMSCLTSSNRVHTFLATTEISESVRTSIQEDREAFLKAFTTGTWRLVSTIWADRIHHFFPVESELKGRMVAKRSGNYDNWSQWEYSPSTGALKIGYSNYVGAMIVGPTLALIDSSGSQTFYYRQINKDDRQYSLKNVTLIQLNERNADQIAKALEGYFQSTSQTYYFEFSPETLNGYLHTFTSKPLSLSGNRLRSDNLGYGYADRLWLVDDMLIFDESNLLIRENKQVRLKPLSDEESEKELLRNRELATQAKETTAQLVLTTTGGTKHTFEVPITDLSEIKSLCVVLE